MKQFLLVLLVFVFLIETVRSQNVGIGTATPLEKLHIQGSVRGNQAGALRISTGTGYVDIGPKNASWSHFETDRVRFYFNKGISVDEGLIGSYDEDLQLQTSGTTRIFVRNADGNVGMGTTNPFGRLHIAGGHLNLGGINDPSNDQGNNWLTWGYRADNTPYYAIRTNYKTYGSYTYSRLQLNWHTGIEIGASTTYGGTRFFDNSPGVGANQIMSIGDGDGHVRVSNYLFSQYINTTDNSQTSGVTGVMVKAGDNYLRTGTPAAVLSYLGVTAPTGDNLGNHTATTTLNMTGNAIVNAGRYEPYGIGGNSGQGDHAYAIFQEGGNWTHPYPDLRIAYHTGIKLGANPSYNGIRFYNDYNMATQIFSVGDGDNNVRVYNNIATVGDIVSNQNYGLGLVGVYSDVRYQNVFAMGSSWRLPADGTTPGNLYGLAWTHSNIGGQSKSGLSHQLLVMENGITKVALGSGVWTNYTSYMPFIYDTDNGGYYLDPNGNSQVSSVYANNWFRAQGQTGFYFQDYGGGWHMEDGTWIRGYNGKSLWMGSGVIGGDGGLTIGYGGAGPPANGAIIKGNTGINMTSPSIPLDVFGAGIFGNNTACGPRLNVGWYFGCEPNVTPISANYGYVGGASYYFYEMYNRYYNAASGYYYFSDQSIKENVRPIERALDKVLKMEGVVYDIKKESHLFNDKDLQSNYGRMGFIAQDFQKILPNAVREIELQSNSKTGGEKAEGTGAKLLTVEYTMAVPVLVEALKEQQALIEKLEKRIQLLEGK